MLPWRCWKESHSSQAGSPVESTADPLPRWSIDGCGRMPHGTPDTPAGEQGREAIMTDRSEDASGAGRHRPAVTVVTVIALAATGGLVALVGMPRADEVPPPEHVAPALVAPTVLLDWDPFSPTHTDLTTDVRYRPRWSDKFSCVRVPADCERVWLHGGDGSQCAGMAFALGLGVETDGRAERIVSTCAEWRASLDAGIYAVNTIQIGAESSVIRLSGLPQVRFLPTPPRQHVLRRAREV